jgi:uncharacterized protein YidB (DUF937 family)
MHAVEQSSEGIVMGLLDNLAGQILGGGNTQGNLVNAIMGMIGNQQSGGLNGLVEQLAKKGLGDIVNSWVSTGKNLPITPQQIQQGLGTNTISEMAKEVGITPDAVTSQLTQLLPQMVDKLTPNGTINQSEILSQGMNLLKGLMK